MLLRGLFLEGAWDGLAYLVTPDFSKLGDHEIWIDAAV